jgi:hypothetical protein
LENLSYSEVLEFNKEIKNAISPVRKTLTDHIDVLERMNSRICATCGNQLSLQTKNLVLNFGPEDFKKRAHFCAFDCLDFFINQLRAVELKREKHEKAQ